MPNKRIHNTEPLEAVQDEPPNDEDDFFNDNNFPVQNEVVRFFIIYLIIVENMNF